MYIKWLQIHTYILKYNIYVVTNDKYIIPWSVSGDVGWSAVSCDAVWSFISCDTVWMLASDISFFSNAAIFVCVSCKTNQ